MKVNRILWGTWLLAAFSLFMACSDDEGQTTETGTSTPWNGQTKEGTVSADVDDNCVIITWNDSATVLIAENLASSVSATIRGGHVTVLADEALQTEVYYTLSGTSADGSLYMDGSYKATFELNGLHLQSKDSAAVNIRDGKRIALKLIDGTSNTLSDASGGTHKACMMVKGHAEFSGGGALTLTGRTGHAFWSKEYTLLKATTGSITVDAAAGDGFNVNQYFQMNGGTVNISGVGDDGIQVSYETDDDGTVLTDEENTGGIRISGGTLNISNTAAGSKGMKAEGPVELDEDHGTMVLSVSSSGGVDTTDSSDPTASACIKSGGTLTVRGGAISLTHNGQGGRAVSGDKDIVLSGGTLTAQAKGSNYGTSNTGGFGRPGSGTSSSNSKNAKGVKTDGSINISGGTFSITSANHEGMEADGTISFEGGETYIQGSDDAINAGSHITVSNGYVCAYSTGNDGIDSNGNCYIKGGTVYAIGSSSPEVAIDANTESGYKLYVSGGTLVAVGGIESGSSLTQTCYSTSSWTRNAWYALTVGSETVLAFMTPASGGSGLVVSAASTPTLKSGVSITAGTSIWNGMGQTNITVSGGTDVTLGSYSGGNQGGGPGGRW